MILQEVLDGVYEVTTDLEEEVWRRCLSELECCQSMERNTPFSEPDLGARTLLVQGEACDSVVAYFPSLAWLTKIVELCRQHRQWNLNWPTPSVDWFRHHTKFHWEWFVVPPEYTGHEYHVDCLMQVVHGLMFITARHDANSTTLFRDPSDGREIAITTGFNRGWIVLQNGKQSHRGININLPVRFKDESYAEFRRRETTARPRYTFKWGFVLQS